MAKPYQGSFQSQELGGAEILIRLESEGAEQNADVYTLSDFNTTVDPRVQNRIATINGGTKTVLGSYGNVSGTSVMKVNRDQAGQDKIDYAYANDEKCIVITETFGRQLGDDITLASGAQGTQFSVSATGVLGNAKLVTALAVATGGGDDLRGTVILVGTNRYPVERVTFNDDGTVEQILIGSSRKNRTNYPFIRGTTAQGGSDGVTAITSGTLKLFSLMNERITYKGKPLNPVRGNLTASTDGTNIPEATVQWAFDSEGLITSSTPTAN